MPVGNGSAGAAFPIAMCVRVRILNVDNSFCHMELNDQSARACGVWIVHNLGTKWKKKKRGRNTTERNMHSALWRHMMWWCSSSQADNENASGHFCWMNNNAFSFIVCSCVWTLLHLCTHIAEQKWTVARQRRQLCMQRNKQPAHLPNKRNETKNQF